MHGASPGFPQSVPKAKRRGALPRRGCRAHTAEGRRRRVRLDTDKRNSARHYSNVDVALLAAHEVTVVAGCRQAFSP